jgi:hypothetical protein
MPFRKFSIVLLATAAALSGCSEEHKMAASSLETSPSAAAVRPAGSSSAPPAALPEGGTPPKSSSPPHELSRPSMSDTGVPQGSGERVPVEERSTPQGFAAEAGTAASHGSPKRLSAETVPLAPMGVDPGRSILDGVENPDRVKDPEADAVRRGRRDAAPISRELSGSFASAEELARVLLEGVRDGDPKALHDLRVTNAEFETIFWPEFPQSRPATNLLPSDGWFFHDASCHDGVSEILSIFGGRDLTLFEVRCTRGRLDFANFDLYDGIAIDAIDSSGERVTIPWAVTFAERNGRWKIYMYKA